MKLQVFSLYDKKTELYLMPVYAHNEGHVRRFFMSDFNNQNTSFNQFPEDYRLFQLGEYDDKTGALIPLPQPRLCCEGIDLVRSKKE